MYCKLSLAAALALGTASVAQAQDSIGFTFDGFVVASTGLETLSTPVGGLDLTFSTGDQSFSNGIGFDGHIVAITNFGSGEMFGSASLTYTSSFGKLSFGLPEVAGAGRMHRNMLRSPFLREFEFTATGNLLNYDLLEVAADGDPVFGVRYDGSVGGGDLSASLHTIANGSDVIAAVAYGTDLGSGRLNAAYQSIVGNLDIYHLDYSADNGSFYYGAGVTAIGSSELLPNAWVGYHVSEALDLQADVFAEGSPALYAFTATYTGKGGLFAEASALTDMVNFGAVVSIGYSF